MNIKIKSLKKKYSTPVAEVIVAHTNVVMRPASWSSGNGDNSGIIEGNPEPPLDPYGAKRFNLWSDEKNEDSKGVNW